MEFVLAFQLVVVLEPQHRIYALIHLILNVVHKINVQLHQDLVHVCKQVNVHQVVELPFQDIVWVPQIYCCVTGGGGSSEYGIDVSSTISSSSASCFKSSGIKFVIPRGYKSTGAVDTQVCTSIKAAATAGISKREAYLFPCPTCSKSASTQVGELVDHLKGNCDGKWTGRIWLDIEGSQYWLGSTSSNQNWYKVSLRISCYIFLSHLLPVFCLFSPSLLLYLLSN
jgi:hypothetical protein